MRLWNSPVNEPLNLSTEEPCRFLSTVTVQSGQEGKTLKKILGQEYERDSMCRGGSSFIFVCRDVCVCVYRFVHMHMCAHQRTILSAILLDLPTLLLRQGLSLARISVIRQSQLASESRGSIKPPYPPQCWISNAHHHKKVGLFYFL